jgi:hypothetical protein
MASAARRAASSAGAAQSSAEQISSEIGVRAPISLEICSAELWAAPAEEAARRAAEAMRAVLAEAG